ncbi:hypothetical protein EDC96DRAFT_518314 [Choanephora cucurbitarum]|nr:hypothetical protein EDC96DRAFT_518314 [Choanephora cucurbitarum]
MLITLHLDISKTFLYEDEHRNIANENDDLNIVDYVTDQNKFVIETVATHTECLKNAVLLLMKRTSIRTEKSYCVAMDNVSIHTY